MEHVAEGTLQAYLDGELAAEENAAVERHVAACVECAAELASLRGAAYVLATSLARADQPLASDDVAHAFQLVRAHAGGLPGSARRWLTGAAPSTRSALLRAALFLLGLAAVASAAIPGSPVRAWLAGAWQEAASLFSEATPGPRAGPARSVGDGAGVSVLPRDGRVRIVLRGPDARTRIHVRLVDGEAAAVRADGGAATARFTSGPGHLELEGGGPGAVRIEVPRAAVWASIEVDGRPYLLKDGADVRILAPLADSGGTEVVFRAGAE